MQGEYFWSVTVEQGSIQAAIWTIKDGVADVITVSNPASWENDESLVSAGDYVLSSCIQNLPDDATEPTKAVFGVAAHWVSDGQIERAHLDKIRLLCNKLSLNPTGFVVLPEAIAHFLKSEEKTPISGVVIGVNDENLDVSVFRLGSLVGTVNVARSESVVSDVVEGLTRFGGLEPIPSRFLLYASKAQDLEEVKQTLIQADWVHEGDALKFLHTPKVEVVENKKKMVAVSLAGASEIAQSTAVTFDSGGEKQKEVENKKEDHANLGGVVDASSLGFVSERKLKVEVAFLKKIDLKKLKFLPIVLIPILLLVGFVAWWVLPHAEVNIVVTPKKIGGNQKVVFDVKAGGVDYSKLIVPAKTVSADASGEKTRTTTGTKTIGNPAKGKVTFYNAGESVVVSSGAILTGSSMQFSLDSEVTVASGSAASIATGQGNITSVGVGADYNLAGGTIFSVGNYSNNLQAKNDSDLSGGSSQDVTAVSKDDVESLSKDLLEQLTGVGKDNIKTSLEREFLLVDDSLVATPSAKQLDHEVGDEAATVKLTETVKVNGVSISKKDMISLARKIYESQVSKGFSLSDDQIDFELKMKQTNFVINLLPSINPDQIKTKIAGKSLSEARKILSSIPGFTDVQIRIKPNIGFLQSLPHIPGNISIGVSAK